MIPLCNIRLVIVIYWLYYAVPCGICYRQCCHKRLYAWVYYMHCQSCLPSFHPCMCVFTITMYSLKHSAHGNLSGMYYWKHSRFHHYSLYQTCVNGHVNISDYLSCKYPPVILNWHICVLEKQFSVNKHMTQASLWKALTSHNVHCNAFMGDSFMYQSWHIAMQIGWFHWLV